jgi:hypothetical protein
MEKRIITRREALGFVGGAAAAAIATSEAEAQQTKGKRNTVQSNTLGAESCSDVYDSCTAGRKAGLSHASPTVCEDRKEICMKSGTWPSNHQGTLRGLKRE